MLTTDIRDKNTWPKYPKASIKIIITFIRPYRYANFTAHWQSAITKCLSYFEKIMVRRRKSFSCRKTPHASLTLNNATQAAHAHIITNIENGSTGQCRQINRYTQTTSKWQWGENGFVCCSHGGKRQLE